MKNKTLKTLILTLLGSLLFTSTGFSYDARDGGGFSVGVPYEPVRLEYSPIPSIDLDLGGQSSLYPTFGRSLESSVFGSDNNYGLSIDPYRGTTIRPSNSSYTDFFSLGAGRRNYDYNYFTNSNLFDSSCKSSCDSGAYNCGWGPITRAELVKRLARCNMTLEDVPLEVKVTEAEGLVSCHSLVVEDPASLDSIAQLIGYDCNTQRKKGESDAKFCGCILKKSANPSEKLFSPLTNEEKSRIAAMTQFDEFQKKTAELQSGLFQVSKILGAAYMDEDTKELFDGEDIKARACLPGSFKAIGQSILNERQEDGKLICGEQGNHRLNEFFKKSVTDCASDSDCAGDWSNLNEIVQKFNDPNRRRKPNMFRFLNRQSWNHHSREYPSGNHSAPEHAGALAHAHFESDAIDIRTQDADFCSTRPETDEAVLEYNARCRDGVSEVGPANMANLNSIIEYIASYRNSKHKTIDAFVAELKSQPAGEADIARIESSMMNDNNLLKYGVFENHAYTNSPFAKILSLVDDSIPENVELDTKNPASLNKAAENLDSGFKSVKLRVAQDAMAACRSYLDSLANTCAKMDAAPEDMIKDKPGVYDMKHFSPADAASRFQQDAQKLGSLHPTTTEGLRRKFELYRCGNIMRDTRLSSMAFTSDAPLDPNVFKQVFASVTDPKVKEGQASQVEEVKPNPYEKPKEQFQEDLANSGDNELEEFGRAIARSGSASRSGSFSGELKNLSDNRLGANPAEGATLSAPADSTTTLNNIADMAKQTLASEGGAASNVSSFGAESDYANRLSSFNKENLENEESSVEASKEAADDRLDVIANRLADLMASKKKNEQARSEKEASSDSDSLSADPKYQEMLIEKLKLEKEIASLNTEKKRKLNDKREFEQKLSAIESEKEAKAKDAASKVAASSKATTKRKESSGATSGGGSSSKGKVSSVGGSSGGSAASGGGGSSSDSTQNFESDANVIRLTQDQVTAVKQKYQLVENPSNWDGVKPPVIKVGNLFFELEVEDGKIVVPYKTKPVKDFGIAALRSPASISEEDPSKKPTEEVRTRKAASADELHQMLRQAQEEKE